MKARVFPILMATMLALSFSLLTIKAQASSNEDSIWVGFYGSIDNWRPVAQDKLILWSSPKRAYLVEIWRPFRSLRHVHAIGVTRTGGRVTDFDHVIVGGERVPIKSIHRLDANVAKGMKYQRT